jgi:hypothetical protein
MVPPHEGAGSSRPVKRVSWKVTFMPKRFRGTGNGENNMGHRNNGTSTQDKAAEAALKAAQEAAEAAKAEAEAKTKAEAEAAAEAAKAPKETEAAKRAREVREYKEAKAEAEAKTKAEAEAAAEAAKAPKETEAAKRAREVREYKEAKDEAAKAERQRKEWKADNRYYQSRQDKVDNRTSKALGDLLGLKLKTIKANKSADTEEKQEELATEFDYTFGRIVAVSRMDKEDLVEKAKKTLAEVREYRKEQNLLGEW